MLQISICSQLLIFSCFSLSFWPSRSLLLLSGLSFMTASIFWSLEVILFVSLCAVSWFHSLMLAKKNFCPLLAIRGSYIYSLHFAQFLFSTQSAFFSVKHLDSAVCHHLPARCSCTLLHFPPEQVACHRADLLCCVSPTDPKVCRETQPQLGAEGASAPQHTGTPAHPSQLCFHFT